MNVDWTMLLFPWRQILTEGSGLRLTMEEIFKDLVYDWIGISPRKVWHALRLRRGFNRAVGRRAEVFEATGVPVPPLVMISVTTDCNLSCGFCYAATHSDTGDMPRAQLDGLIDQAKELGSFFFLLTGGEPLLYPSLLDVIEQHPDAVFFAFTNGTKLTSGMARRISRMGNFILLLGLDGGREETDKNRGTGVYELVRRACGHLRDAGAFFGFSVTVTSHNVENLGGADFLAERRQDGCRLGFYIEYLPLGRQPDTTLCLTPDQRVKFRSRFLELRRQERMFLVQFPDDEHEAGGCLAAGRGLIHINAAGFVEPCPAFQMAADNIGEKSLLECLRSPFLRSVREQAAAQAGSEPPENEAACSMIGKEAKLLCASSTADPCGCRTNCAEVERESCHL